METFTATASSSSNFGRDGNAWLTLYPTKPRISSRKEIVKGNRSKVLFIFIKAISSSDPGSSLLYNGRVVSLLTYLVRPNHQTKGERCCIRPRNTRIVVSKYIPCLRIRVPVTLSPKCPTQKATNIKLSQWNKR